MTRPLKVVTIIQTQAPGGTLPNISRTPINQLHADWGHTSDLTLRSCLPLSGCGQPSELDTQTHGVSLAHCWLGLDCCSRSLACCL